MPSVRVLVGTKKGAFILTSDGKRQKWDKHDQMKQMIEGEPVHNISAAPRGRSNGQLWGNLATAGENYFNFCRSRRGR